MSSAQPPPRRQQQQQQPQSLKAAYLAAERQREAIERGAFQPGGGGATSYGDAVRAALDAYEECGRRAAALALFSTNESADDVATAHLPYLLVPFRAAELAQRVPTSPSGGPAERRAVLRRARDAYERFLHQLDGYGLLTAAYARLLQAYTEDPAHFSTVGAGGGSSTSSGGGGSAGGVAGLADPAARRSAKIANFRTEKELRGKLDVLRQRQEQRRAQQQRRRKLIRAREGEDEDEDESAEQDDGIPEEDEDDGDDDEEDEEEARKLYLAQLAYSAHMAFQGLDGLTVEDEILAQAPARPPQPPHGSTAGGLGDSRQRGADAPAGYSDRLEDPLSQARAPGLRLLQSALAGSPTWAGAVNPGPLLTKDGKPKQPFTILGNRAEMTRAVFRPGHNLPTMSIDEYLEEERKRGGIIEGGGPSSGVPPPPDEDNYDKADAETMKARAWDEFTESNARGSGNTLNRG